MIPTGDHGVCEHCQKPGILALFRSPLPIETGWDSSAQCRTVTYAIALCVGCADRSGFPRFLDSTPAAAQVEHA